MLLKHCKAVAPSHEFSFQRKLYSLDATLIELCVRAFPWATYRQTKGAVKLNMLLDHDGYLPVFMDFTHGDVHYEMLYKWNLNGIDFVTRLKSNATYETPDFDLKQYPGNVLSDEVIYLRGSREKIS